MRAVLVVELDLDNGDHLVETMDAVDWRAIPHFGGSVRVAFDGINGEDVATNILIYIDTDRP